MAQKIAPETEERIAKLVERLRAEGFRVTPQRLEVLRLLLTTDRHPSAEDLYDQLKRRFPTLSLATVYKTMETLRSMGEVLYLEFKEGSTRYDGRFPYPHTHLICSSCGRIEDLIHDPVTADVNKAVTQSGFALSKYRFDLYGLCKDCQKAPGRATVSKPA